MRKPVNSEIDLIRAIYARSNDLLLEAKKTPVKTILTPEQIASMKNRGIGVSSTGSGDATPIEISDRVAAAKAAAVAKPAEPTAAATPIVAPKSEEDLADEREMAAWRRNNPSVLADLRNDIAAAQPTKRTVGLQDILDDAGETVAVTKTKGTPKAKKNKDTTVKIGAVAQEEPEEKKLLDTLFKKSDTNKNGSVSKQEFSKLLDTKVPNPITPTVSTQDEYPMDEPDVAPLTPEETSQTKSIVQGAEGGFSSTSSTSRGKRVPVIQASAYASPEDSETSARPIIAASNNVRWPFSKEGYVGSSYTSPTPAEVQPKTSHRNSTKISDALTPQIRNADGSLSPQFPLIQNGSPEWLAWNKTKDQKRIDAGLPLLNNRSVNSKSEKKKTNTERGPDAQGNEFKQGMTDVHRDESNNPITSERFPQGIMQTNAGLHFYPDNPTARFHLDSLMAKGSPESFMGAKEFGFGGGKNFIPHLPLGQYDRGTGEIIAAPHSENINLLDPSTKQHSDYLSSLVKPPVTTGRSQETSDSRESETLGDDPTSHYTNPGSIPLEKQKRRMGYSPVSRADAAVKLSKALSDVTSLTQNNKDTGYVNW